MNITNKTPIVPDEVPILDEDYDEFIEWTSEEEEAFVDIMNQDNQDL